MNPSQFSPEVIEKFQRLMETPLLQKTVKIVTNEKILNSIENISQQPGLFMKYAICLLLLWLFAFFLQRWLNNKCETTIQFLSTSLFVSLFKIASFIIIAPFLIFRNDYIIIVKEAIPLLLN